MGIKAATLVNTVIIIIIELNIILDFRVIVWHYSKHTYVLVMVPVI